jgi:type I restriction enzyme S subunit
MIEDLRPYGQYQPMASRWIPRVPSHWELRKMRTLTTPHNERNRADLPLLSVAREKGVFVRSTDDENHNVIPHDLTNYKVARAGSLVINKMKAWQGSMGIAPCDGIVSPAYFVYDLSVSNGAFGQALLRSRPYVAHFGQASDGVRIGQWDLSIPRMREIPLAIPPADEQTAIVSFLAHASHRIERYIREKRKIITLLNEQKQAIIQRAVTLGLDSKVPLRDSGVPWLGEIPAHWEVLQFRRLLSFVTSGSRGWASYYTDSGFIFLQSGNLGRSMALNLSFVQHVRPPSGSEGERTRVKINDILVCITGALTGNVALVDTELYAPAFVNQHVALCRPRSDLVVPRFMAYSLHSDVGRKQFKTNEYGGTKQGLGLGQVKNVWIAVPPRREQVAICSALDSETRGVLEAISHAEREIELMREYRARLIADVVTGQLDVREAARHLPAEALASVGTDNEDAALEDDEPGEGAAA